MDAIQEMLDIDDVEPFSEERDGALFKELREVLFKHDAAARFGISLLHRHFDMKSYERLVETCDVSTRTLTLRPISGELPADAALMQTNWRFDPTGQSPVQLCYVDCLKTGKTHKGIHKKNWP